MKKNLLSIGIFMFMIVILAGCSKAGGYYRDGKKSFEAGNYEEAAEDFVKAIAQNPNRADYYIEYGMTLIALHKYEDALVQFDIAYMDKDMSIIKENNKRVLRGKGIAYYNMNEYKKAIEEFEKAIKADELPELNVDILYYKASSLKAIGSYKEAIDTYETILSSNKNSATAYGERALCYKCMGMYHESLADYDSAISIDSDNYKYYFGKYFLMEENNDAEGAAKILSQAAEIKVKTDEDKYNLARIHFYQENYDVALTELEECFNAGFHEAYYDIGEIYRIKKDYTNAIYYFESYISLGDAISPNVYNQVAVCLIKTGDNKKAIEYLEKGIEYNDASTMQILKKNEIIAYENMIDFDKANEKLNEYRDSYPEDEVAIRETEFLKTRLMDTVTQ